MILYLSAALLLVRKCASAGVDGELTGWYQAPNFRGTWDLILSCVVTLTICVWSALHLNIPAEDSHVVDRSKTRLRWILLGIFVPDLVVATAFGQYLAARWLMREIQKDVEYHEQNGTDPRWSREQQLRKWTFTQCYFAVMGGVRTETGDFIAGRPRVNLTAEGLRLMSFLGRLPGIYPTSYIKDKSKANRLAKSLVVLQASWLVIQTIARVNQRLPVTLLEINTIGHVVCAFALYASWWEKPLDIKEHSFVLREAWMDKIVATMWMCSPISYRDQDDFISEIRCMCYTPPSERGILPISDVANMGDMVEGSIRAGSTREQRSENLKKPHKTRSFIGTIGALNAQKFIGPLERFKVVGDDGKLSYEIKEQPVAAEHDVFLREEKSHYGLKHSRYYCRRALKDCLKHDPLGEMEVERWRLANELVDELWSECEKRPEYKDFFFTKSSLGLFVGELIYIADHIPNFPGVTYLHSVNVHNNLLKFVVALAGAAYGGLHLSAWNDYFPTEIERWLWIGCSLATGVTAGVLALFFLATQKIKAFENLVYFIRRNQALKWFLASLATPAFITARVFIVVEAFISLRKAPAAIYKTPEFIKYIPHL